MYETSYTETVGEIQELLFIVLILPKNLQVGTNSPVLASPCGRKGMKCVAKAPTFLQAVQETGFKTACVSESIGDPGYRIL